MAAKRVCAGRITNPKWPDVGRPCRRWAVNGSDYCAVHGGNIAKVKAMAETSEHRCTAKAHKTGERCRNRAIPGGTVCRYHGGASGHVIRKARERFNDLVDPMINIATKLTADALDGKMSHSDQMRLIAFIADRTGYNPGVTVQHETPKWQGTMTHIVKKMPEEGFFDTLPIEPGPVVADVEDDIEDAEVVEDDDPRDYLPRIVPLGGDRGKASIKRPTRVVGSADPPRGNLLRE